MILNISSLRSLPGSVYGAGVTVIQAGLQFLFMAIVARYYGMEKLGAVSFINAIQLILFMFFSLGLRNAIVIDYPKYDFRSLLCTRIVMSFIALMIGGVVVYVLNLSWFLYVCLFAFKFLEVLSEMNWSLLQVKSDHFSIFFRQTCRWIFTFLTALWASSTGCEFDVFIIIYLISAILSFVLLELKSITNSVLESKRPVVITPIVKSYWRLSLSLFLMSLQQNAIRILVGLYFGNAFLGVFSIIYQIYSMLYMIFMNGLNFILVKRNSYVNKVLRNITVSFVYVLVVAAVWHIIGLELLSMIFGKQFYAESGVVLMVILSLIFRLIAYVLQFDLTQRGSFTVILKTQFSITVSSLLLTCLLLEFLGENGGYLSIPLGGVLYLIFMMRAYRSKGGVHE